jgi:hypothetical protein
VIAPSEPAGAIRGGEQRLDLVGVEVTQQRTRVAFGRDLDYSRDRLRVLGMTQSGLSPVGRYPQQAAGRQGFRRKVRGWFDDRLRIISMPADPASVLVC